MLAWVFTIAYIAVGWWVPMALALITLAFWPVDAEGPDSLTGLPGVRRFEDFLDGAIDRTRHGLARGGVLVAIDLDNFGRINKDPHLGQAIGDEVLAEIGRRLRSQTRTGDAVARPGGDEFAGLLRRRVRPGVRDPARGTAAEGDQRPVVTTAGIVEVGASIGLVIVAPVRTCLPGSCCWTGPSRRSSASSSRAAASASTSLASTRTDPATPGAIQDDFEHGASTGNPLERPAPQTGIFALGTMSHVYLEPDLRPDAPSGPADRALASLPAQDDHRRRAHRVAGFRPGLLLGPSCSVARPP